MVEMLTLGADYTVTSLDRERLADCVDVIIDALEIFGFNRAGYSPVRTVDRWCALLANCPSGSWMDVVKYKIAAFFSAWSHQPLPKAPFSVPDKADCILTGVGYRWIRAYLSSVDRREFWCVLTTILYSKKGFPRPDAEQVEKAVKKTVAFLTSEHHPIAPQGFEVLDSWEQRGEHSRLYGHKKSQRTWGYYVTQEDVLREIDRTVDELYHEEDAEIDLCRPRFPSTSANYNRSRSGLGAFVEVANVARRHYPEWIGASKVEWEGMKVRDTLDRREHFHPSDGFLPPHRRRPIDVAHTMHVSEGHKLFLETGWQAFQQSSYLDPLREESIVQTAKPKLLADARTLDYRLRRIYDKVYEEALQEPKIVEAVGLAEALKVRVISKGPPLTYTALQPVQKATHAALARHRCFALIGNGGTSEGYLAERLGSRLPEGEGYLSGDYKSSTDYINPLYSERVVNRISDRWNFSPDLRRLYLESLTGHTFEITLERGRVPEFLALYEDPFEREEVHQTILAAIAENAAMNGGDQLPFVIFQLPQLWGQLMGSITSFPILCIINACICRMSLEFAVNERITLDDARLMVNGDDCLLRVNAFGKRFWEQVGTFVGLQPSVGKTYYDTEYMNINSTSFFIGDEHPVEIPDIRSNDPNHVTRAGVTRITEVPYVNLGLLNGLTRSGTLDVKPKSESESSKTVGAKAHELLKGHSEERSVKIFKKFLNHNWKKLNEVRVPWYMPEWIGGLGLPWVGRKVGAASLEDVDEYSQHISYEYGPTRLDRLLAHGILLNWNEKHPTKMPATGIWQIHDYVMGRLPMQPVTSLVSNPELEKAYESTYAAISQETLFTEFPDFIADADSSNTDPQVHVLRRNERLWSKAAPVGPPCSFEALAPRSTYQYLPVAFIN